MQPGFIRQVGQMDDKPVGWEREGCESHLYYGNEQNAYATGNTGRFTALAKQQTESSLVSRKRKKARPMGKGPG